MRNLSERQLKWLLAGVGLASFTILLLLEILTEEDSLTLVDVLFDAVEPLVMISIAAVVALLSHRLQAQHEERLALIRDLGVARSEGERWRAKVQSNLNGIRFEMENQFREWGMTAAEREVGLLILKGLNHKEIGALRGTSEATVRQQAQAIYRKATLPGRTAFSAYFLEDLFAPDLPANGPDAAAAAPDGAVEATPRAPVA